MTLAGATFPTDAVLYKIRINSVAYDIASRAELETISVAFREWVDNPDGVFIVPHAEIIARA